MNKVIDLINTGELPKSTPHTCKCGGELITNPNMTTLECINYSCPFHQGYKLLNILDIFNIKCGIGEVKAINIIADLNIPHHMLIFKNEVLKELMYYSNEVSHVKLYNSLIDVRQNPIPLYKFINAFQLETLGTTRSKLIFSSYSSLEEFYDKFGLLDIDTKNYNLMNHIDFLEFLSGCLKIDTFSDTVMDIGRELIEVRNMLLNSVQDFNIQKVHDKTIYIAITGAITRQRDDDGNLFSPRQKYCEYLSQKSSINVIFTNLSKKHIDYLIMDTDMTNNSKYKKAMSMNIPIKTSDELYNELVSGGHANE